VLRFLLSNVRFWLEEYNLDGFRFDGVTSMLYHHHGLGHGFSSYDDYFGPAVDDDAVTYLQLANQLAYAVRPGVITVAEDVSGMAGLARPVDEGGIGFDYRLAMGIPDFWIKTLKEKRDEDWNMNEVVHTLMNRRFAEKHVGYAESHDQALVGDKTLAFWLMDAEMYWHMNKGSRSLVIDRGVAMHKMLRLVTFALGGEGYLNFMGNEFGHPEWIDFPRAGNGYSYKYARRQWSLADNDALRYRDLQAFDRAMMMLDERFGILADSGIDKLDIDDSRKCIMVARGPLVFLLNFHPTQSYTDLRVGVPRGEDYRIILDTDAKELGGFGLVKPGNVYPLQRVPQCGKLQSLQVYLPSRTAQVLAPVTLA
jgi:1,4-alpha-glucan branching enzyme